MPRTLVSIIAYIYAPPSCCLGFPLDDGGSDITSYTIERQAGAGKGEWQTVATVADPRTFRENPSTPHTSLAHTISQLSPGVSYQFRVIAVNKVGVCTCTCTLYVPHHVMYMYLPHACMYMYMCMYMFVHDYTCAVVQVCSLASYMYMYM